MSGSPVLLFFGLRERTAHFKVLILGLLLSTAAFSAVFIHLELVLLPGMLVAGPINPSQHDHNNNNLLAFPTTAHLVMDQELVRPNNFE